MASDLFTDRFLRRLKDLVATHHTIYPSIPPQGIYFEALAERAFRDIGRARVILSTPNSPQHDLQVDDIKISLKTETGKNTRRNLISITKLCTTETGAWNSTALTEHVLRHLSRYDHLLMLRAIWGGGANIHYQVLEIPLTLLQLIASVNLGEAGRRKGRRSLAGDAYLGERRVFHVRLDGADGKCQAQRLDVGSCLMLLEWDHPIS